MEINNLNDYLSLLKPVVLPYTINSTGIGRQLKENKKPFISTPSTSGIRYCSNIFSSPKILGTLIGNQSLTAGLSTLLASPIAPQIIEKNSNDILLKHRKELTLTHLPFFSIGKGNTDNYLTSSIVVVAGNDGEINLSYHRAQFIDKDHLVLRVVKRDLHKKLSESNGKLKCAIILGVDPFVALAAAFSPTYFGGELTIAGGFAKKAIPLVNIESHLVPSNSQVVIIGEFTGETHDEGPFVDLTGTLDPVRKQPVFKVNSIYSKPDPVIPIILPSSGEHALLMGIPRAAAIFSTVSLNSRSIRDVSLTPGGVGWLHLVVSFSINRGITPLELGEKIFSVHPSLKRITFVNEDIDPNDPTEVEWALATRFQPHRDLFILRNQKGSSLDPSSSQSITSKWILDATVDNPFNNKFKKIL